MNCSTISKLFVRSYFKQIEPLKIIKKQRPPRMGQALKKSQRARESNLESQQFEEESRTDEANMMDSEIDMEFIKNHGYELHQEETEYRRLRAKQSNMTRKHFRSLISKKEVSILTYAEKQTIKYLNEMDPDEWTHERIAQAFPITESGVTKLLKTKNARPLTSKEIIEHDERIVKNLERIRAGDFGTLSPEFEEKIQMRKTIPMKIGDTSSILGGQELVKSENQSQRVIGEFERLIIENGNEKPSTESIAPVSQPISAKADENLNSKFTEEQFERDQFNSQLGSKQRLTLDQFESKVRKRRTKMELPSDELERIHVLLNIPKSVEPNPVDSKQIMDETTIQNPTIDDYMRGASGITKFKKDLKSDSSNYETGTNPKLDKIEVRVEKDQGSYIYDEKTNQYQKPFTINRTLKVEIPDSMKQTNPEDSIYKIGDAYYDEDGRFLYRVV